MAERKYSQGGIYLPSATELQKQSTKGVVANNSPVDIGTGELSETTPFFHDVSKVKKRFEFSKIMLTLVTSMSLLLTFFGLIYMWVNHDSTLFSYIIGGWFVELATATGFYYNKAKAENVEKFRQNGVLNYTDYMDPERNDM